MDKVLFNVKLMAVHPNLGSDYFLRSVFGDWNVLVLNDYWGSLELIVSLKCQEIVYIWLFILS